MSGKLKNLEILLHNLSIANNSELYLVNKISNLEGLENLISGFNNSQLKKELTYDLTASYDTRYHKWGAFPNTLHSKLKINKNFLKISSFEIFTNISTNKYSDILKQTFVIWTSSNDKKTIENIINKFNYIDNPIEVDYINGVIKYDISATNFFSNIV